MKLLLKLKLLSNQKDKRVATIVSKFTLIFIISSIVNASLIVVSNAHPHLTTESKVSVNGIGPILIGMTVEEAEAAAGVRILPIHPEIEFCPYYETEEPKGIIFVAASKDQKITRIEIENKQISTISNVGIGDTTKHVKSTYLGQITEGTGFYGGKYLLYKPRDLPYQKYRLLFEVYENHVTSYRIATTNHIGTAVEICS